MNVNNSKLLLFIPVILEHVSRNCTCSIGKLRTHNKKHVITEPSRTPGSPSELDPGVLKSPTFSISNYSCYLNKAASRKYLIYTTNQFVSLAGGVIVLLFYVVSDTFQPYIGVLAWFKSRNANNVFRRMSIHPFFGIKCTLSLSKF